MKYPLLVTQFKRQKECYQLNVKGLFKDQIKNVERLTLSKFHIEFKTFFFKIFITLLDGFRQLTTLTYYIMRTINYDKYFTML